MDGYDIYGVAGQNQPMPGNFLSNLVPANIPQAPVDQLQNIPSPASPPVPPEIQHLNDVVQQYTDNKQQQQGGLTQQILQQRFQPTVGDAATAGLREIQSYASPQGFRPYSPDEVMAQRYANDYSPYTSMIEPQMKQAQLDQTQITNQFLPQKEQAQIDLLKATALMNQGGGLFGGAPGQSGSISNLSGSDFLKTLPPAAANMVQAIAEGRQPLPSGFVLKTPFGQQLLAAVGKYDPTFDFVNSSARMATRKSFTSGADATNIAALNTAMAHLSTLNNSYQGLNNTSFPMYNAAKNYLGNQFGNPNIQTATANVGADAEAVSHELAKVFRSTGMSEGEINSWKDKINTSAGPDQMKAVVQSALDLMEGRMQALAEKYKQGMGVEKNGLEMLSPQAQQAYKSLRGNEGANPPQATSPPQAASGQNIDPALLDELKKRGLIQ